MDAVSLKNLREVFGFVVTDDRDPDLLGYLFDAFLEGEQKLVDEVLARVPEGTDFTADTARLLGYLKKFVEFARTKLRENPPMTLTYMPRGLAVQLQNYQQVLLVEPEQDAPDTGDTRAKGTMGVTTANRGGSGIPGFSQKDAAVPVTGVRKK